MTTVTTRYAPYQFETMLFGIMNASTTFQLMMYVVIHCLPFKSFYIDEVAIFSKSVEEHVSHTREVFQRLKDRGLKIKLSKCYFPSPQPLLGHATTSHGVRVDECKIASIKNFPVPTTPTELHSFLDLAGYYRRFIKRFAENSSVLHDATVG